MNLYTFLLINDDIITNDKLFSTASMTDFVDLKTGTAKRNRIYTYKEDPRDKGDRLFVPL